MNKEYRYIAKLVKLENDKKKYLVIVHDVENNIKKVIKFGDSRYEDYLTHKNFTRKLNYKLRHQRDYINNPMYAGFWSYWLLWNKKTLEKSIKDIKKRFNIMII